MPMPIRVELTHVDSERVVVRASVWLNGEEQDSAFGEAASVEEAEDRARSRLSRLQQEGGDVAQTTPPTPKPHPRKVDVKPPSGSEQQAMAEISPAASTVTSPSESSNVVQETQAPSEAPTDPEDWSEELAAIDLECRRLGWDRDLERVYLERAFGHGSRHRLTRYSDLVAYLRQLKSLPGGTSPETASVPIRRSDLLDQGNQMLEQLKWNSDQARDFLQQHLGANSRQQLSDEQLLQFNMLLEEQTLKATA